MICNTRPRFAAEGGVCLFEIALLIGYPSDLPSIRSQAARADTDTSAG